MASFRVDEGGQDGSLNFDEAVGQVIKWYEAPGSRETTPAFRPNNGGCDDR